MSKPVPHFSIRFQLTCLVVACILPFWLIAGYLVYQTYTSKLNKVKTDILENARDMTTRVDRELSSIQATLLALATSPSFERGDFATVHRQALDALKSYPGAEIIVSDASGQELDDSALPFGTPLPRTSTPETVRAVFESGKPAVSNLILHVVTKRPLVSIDVPVLRGGRVVYDLSMTLNSQRMAAWLPVHNLPHKWYCSVLDRKGIMAARTEQPERYLGKRVTPALFAAITSAAEGTTELTNMAGVRVLSAFSRSPISGWTVAMGVPKESVLSEVYGWVTWAIGVSTLISVLAIVSAMAIASRIASDIQALVEPALAIGAGESVAAIGITHTKETAEVADALVQASELLSRRAGERDLAERELSRTIEDLQRETSERLRTMDELRKNEQLLLHQSRQAALGEMIGNIAHQWRQPLNALGLLIQQPAMHQEAGLLTPEFLEENTDKSMEILQHMSRTIDDFRNFFKPDKEKVNFRVSEEVGKTLSLMEGSFLGHRIAVEVRAKGEPVIEGYPNEFCQVLLNILNNAKDAVAERGIALPKVVITIEEGEGGSVVTVADNAGGIPEEIIGRIFDPYFTTKGPQSGTGVGLFMSKTIIEKNMNGQLTVRNLEGGAEFRIQVLGISAPHPHPCPLLEGEGVLVEGEGALAAAEGGDRLRTVPYVPSPSRGGTG
ncbi:ATP-binding protein [Geomonas sp.]|uniref:ATP-binding protein n=1 Tax=Geomonas sp. TaxID=2651584 RepID=UPI002B485467|nr:ATP-binding protein [Geomonas sp.]HJV34566.1 ATP-binding protein [Geomonas sp.]